MQLLNNKVTAGAGASEAGPRTKERRGFYPLTAQGWEGLGSRRVPECPVPGWATGQGPFVLPSVGSSGPFPGAWAHPELALQLLSELPALNVFLSIPLEQLSSCLTLRGNLRFTADYLFTYSFLLKRFSTFQHPLWL